MKSFGNYFWYHFRSTLLRFSVIAILCTILTLTFAWDSYIAQDGYRYSYAELTVLATVAIVISTVIPILELLPFKNRRNMDTLLFLPLDRTKLGTAHFLNGLLQVIGIELISFVAVFCLLVAHSYPFSAWNFLLLFAFTVLGSLSIYAVTAFVFDRANTTADGLIWLVLYSFIGCCVFVGVKGLYEYSVGQLLYTQKTDLFTEGIFSPYFLLIDLWYKVSLILIPDIEYYEENGTVWMDERVYSGVIENNDIAGMIIGAVFALLFTVGFLWLFRKKRPERIGAVSDSPFGYKVLLPLFSVSWLCDFLSYTGQHLAIALTGLMIGYIIYRRSIRLKMQDYISIAVALILPLILTVIAKCF